MGTHILVVDDDETIRSLLSMVFEREGWKVVTAENGVEAVAALSTENFDLMVADLHMPKMNGYELIPRALELKPAMPIIVLSADSTIDSIGRVFQHAIKGFMPKPVDDVVEVVAKARSALEASRGRRDLQAKLARVQSMLARASDDADGMG